MNNKALKKNSNLYEMFRQINGEHPFRKKIPEAVVEYRARRRKGGKVAFFNFDLAREIGLIPKEHGDELTKSLNEIILDTFSLMIINEYDIINKVKIEEKDILPHTYFATRYLQLQHPCKKGTTSGDGRSIWNGRVVHKGKSYDISSCGTGATKLSPACNINKKFYKTGDPSISYGCGFSEKDEGMGTLFFSEVLNQNGINTERVLAIIEFEKGLAINVRVHDNLLRPSHFFNHLKQNNLITLKKVVDYYIDLEISNGKWSKNLPSRSPYDFLLSQIATRFSAMAATFEDQYIFCWLDWDGDNILMDGGIIDYGSIRQFGLYHHEYRYDDVERWSTSIKEQKQKARYIVQCFVQIVDYLKTHKKKPLEDFKNHSTLKFFDDNFKQEKLKNLLYKVGFKNEYAKFLIESHSNAVEEFLLDFSYFEMAKSKKGPIKVADGINWNAIFCMRDILRELPQLYLSRGEFKDLSSHEFIDIMKSSYATKKDLIPNSRRVVKIKSFQKNYWKLFLILEKKYKTPIQKILLEVTMRSSVINRYDRVTGDSISLIVDKIMSVRPKIGPDKLSEILHDFKTYQNLTPDRPVRESNFEKGHEGDDRSPLLKGMLKLVRDLREGI